jgi:hypothetical protein
LYRGKPKILTKSWTAKSFSMGCSGHFPVAAFL